MRLYELALPKARLAVEHFNTHKVSRVLHLGDIIDGNETREQTEADMKAVLDVLAPLEAPLIHVVGNHCLELGRASTLASLGLSTAVCSTHRAIDLSAHWRLIVLDTMACSLRGSSYTEAAMARKYLETHRDDPNATVYNGGLGADQTAWLRTQLTKAKDQRVSIILAAHHPFSLQVAPLNMLVWNREELLALLADFRHTVRAVFTGHYHYGGYAIEDDIHHVVFESIVDSTSKQGSHAVVNLFDDRIEICGIGDMQSRVLTFTAES